MNASPPNIDTREVGLVCWLDWYDGPVSGLARWKGEVFWFAMDGDVGSEPRSYELFALTRQQIAESLAWFEEKRDWFETRAPMLRTVRSEILDPLEQEREIALRGLALREWNGPVIKSSAIARFDDAAADQSWFSREGWRLPEEFVFGDDDD